MTLDKRKKKIKTKKLWLFGMATQVQQGVTVQVPITTG